MDGMLSQEEINALLGSMGDDDSSGSDGSQIVDLSPDEKDALGEISNICMGTAATTLYSLVNQKVVITTPSVTASTWDQLCDGYNEPCVFINISYQEGVKGNNVLILKENDVKIITDLMMGGDGTGIVDELSELHMSAICEAMNQMMGSASTSMSSMLNRKIDITPPTAELVKNARDIVEDKISAFVNQGFAMVSFRMEIGDLVDSSIMQLYPLDFARELLDVFSMNQQTETADAKNTQEEKPAPAPAPQQTAPPQQAAPPPAGGYGQPMPGMAYGQPAAMPYPYAPPAQDVNVQSVQFQPFATGVNPVSQQENIDLIMDVPLEVTVELGRTSKSIKEILEFSPGTIIELDRIAGEPIDVLVNGKLVAKGEVVVIEESFGIRVTDIIKQKNIM